MTSTIMGKARIYGLPPFKLRASSLAQRHHPTLYSRILLLEPTTTTVARLSCVMIGSFARDVIRHL